MFTYFRITMIGLCSMLIAEDYYVPEVQSGDGNMTYIGIINPGLELANFTVTGFGADGTDYSASDALTDLNSMGMAYISILDLFGEHADNIAWVKVTSADRLHVIAEIMNQGTRSAFWSADSLSNKLIIPHVAKNTEAFTTVFSSVNGSNSGLQSVAKPKPSGSAKVLHELDSVNGKAKKNVLDLWSDVSNINWVSLESAEAGNCAMEYFTYNTKQAMASLGLEDTKGKTLRFLHVATDTRNFWTGMVYINVGEAATEVTETYFDADGNILKTFKPETLEVNAKATLLFDANSQDRVPAGTAWVMVSSDQDLVGYELFGSANGTNDATFAGIQGNYTEGDILDYPYFTSETNTWSGFVAVNVGSETADLTFNLMDSSGSVVGTYVESGITPNRKFIAVGAAMFPDVATKTSGYMWVQAKASGSKWAGFLLWGDQGGINRDHLSGVNAKIRKEQVEIERAYIPESEPNNGFATAQVLNPVSSIFNINVIATADMADEGEIVRSDGGFNDDMEDVYSFTLTERKALLVATSTSNPAGDVDLYIFKGEKDFNIDIDQLDYQLLTDIDYSASPRGFESVMRVFEPGTYYILVSNFDAGSNPVESVSYGLLVTEKAIFSETFDFNPDLDSWPLFVTSRDADQQHAWQLTDDGLVDKFGACLVNKATLATGIESAWLYTPAFSPLDTGITIIDWDQNFALPNKDSADNEDLWYNAVDLFNATDGENNALHTTGSYFTRIAEKEATLMDEDVFMFKHTWCTWGQLAKSNDDLVLAADSSKTYRLGFNYLIINNGSQEIVAKDTYSVLDNIRVFNIRDTHDPKAKGQVIVNHPNHSNAKPQGIPYLEMRKID